MAGLRSKIAIRCDASPEIGTGHVMRCLALAGELSKFAEVLFISSPETLGAAPTLARSGYEIKDEYSGGADWLIVDHYGLDETYESAARAWAKKIFVIDDLADRGHDCDILLDQTYGRKAGDYNNLAPAHCRILTGTDYAILRPEFVQARRSLDISQRQGDRVLISFGGVNPKNATEFALESLALYREKPLYIDVVTGAGAQNLENVKKLSKKIKAETSHAVTLHIGTNEMAALMARADLCIGAGGTTSWERCCMKLPAITLELADNQKTILQALSDFGAILHLGKIEEIDSAQLLAKASDLLNAPDKRLNLSSGAAEICDGQGTKRIVEILRCS